MAGHSKWHNIKHKKAATDAKKSKIYAKVAKIITMAAKSGADPSMNPALETALQKAKYNSLPKDVIEKAIKKGSGQTDGENYEELVYEGYGPGGVALLVKALTSNTNRTNTNLKIIFQKGGGNIAELGAVSWQFQEKGVILVDGKTRMEIIKGNETEFIDPYDQDILEEALMEQDIEDYTFEEDFCEIITSKENYISVLNALEKNSWHIKEADLQYLSDNEVAVDDETGEKVLNLIDALEEDDDVDTVYHNMG